MFVSNFERIKWIEKDFVTKNFSLEKIIQKIPKKFFFHFFFVVVGKDMFLEFCLKVSKSFSQNFVKIWALDKIWLNLRDF